mmetsp:Transcript_19905/g.32752  ORF Transcript_19905/g.32752 Transcript_19905/m.32752 type:complete len:338 (-) Transcript_19905:1726-2739(-)
MGTHDGEWKHAAHGLGLKVLTQNLWYTNSRVGPSPQEKNKLGNGEWHERCRAFRKWLVVLDPDVVCLQEVLVGNGLDMLDDVFGSNDDGLGCDLSQVYKFREYAVASPWWVDPKVGFCNAIVSKHPITETFTLKLPMQVTPGDPYNETRGAITCHIKLENSGQVIAVTCTHLNYRLNHSAIRLRQAVSLSAFVQRHKPKHDRVLPCVICGDFNGKPEDACIRYLSGSAVVDVSSYNEIEGAESSVAYYDAWVHGKRPEYSNGVTWSSYNPNTLIDLEEDKRLDYIFVEKCFENGVGMIEECRVVCDHPFAGAFPSDHFGVLVELRTESRVDRPKCKL